MTDPQYLVLDAVDSLMFRDGRPFNQADDGASRAVSVFPPYPPTIVGAVRAALWQGPLAGTWNKAKLGTGTNWQKDSLGPLSFGPPTLLKNGEPLFPVPRHVVEGTKHGTSGKIRTFLRPGDDVLECDLGKVRLPEPDRVLDGLKPVEDEWLTLSGIRTILDQKEPKDEHVIKRDRVWGSEDRVGIGIVPDTRAVHDGHLYMASHIRLADDVTLGVTLHNADRIEKRLRPLAGEHRMAEIDQASKPFHLPEHPKDLTSEHYCIILLSPLVPMQDNEKTFANMPGTIVSACLGKAIPIGGWDSQKKQSIPLRRAIPAGSVWFMKTKDIKNLRWPKGLGIGTNWGFGQYLIGKW
ncbi:type III-B CRISPR module-associated Cmr3 family protein [Thalassospira povalilytica]|uniref:type III-B CRISPR module-associated Cmr3 family protein n=1 Tax=Thalassospira povalilytica TaxID=732237 RepID=UPI003AA843FE